jgi:hypothetical protein
VLVVVGSRHDLGALELVKRWERWGAALLSCEDLSAPGWRYSPADRRASRAVIDGRIVREGDIRGVLVRRPHVLQQELAHIATADREFVAAEMSAFLFAWLSHLRCRVLNRPRGTSLCGPNWRPQQWIQAAARVGLEVEPIRQQVPARAKANVRNISRASRNPVQAVIVGERCLGEIRADQADGARKLAAAAGVGLLAVWFAPGNRTSRFVAASAMPSLAGVGVAEAVREHLLSS